MVSSGNLKRSTDCPTRPQSSQQEGCVCAGVLAWLLGSVFCPHTTLEMPLSPVEQMMEMRPKEIK